MPDDSILLYLVSLVDVDKLGLESEFTQTPSFFQNTPALLFHLTGITFQSYSSQRIVHKTWQSRKYKYNKGAKVKW